MHDKKIPHHTSIFNDDDIPQKYLLIISYSTASAAVVHIPPVVKNLARGSFLKCAADLTGGLVSGRYFC